MSWDEVGINWEQCGGRREGGLTVLDSLPGMVLVYAFLASNLLKA